jgi:hypothetical protein
MAELSRELLRLYGLGVLTATDVQRLAASGGRDGWGATSAIAKKLIKCGGSGRLTGNINRDLLCAITLSGIVSGSLKPYTMNLADGSPLDIILPHEAWHNLLTRTAGSVGPWTLGDRVATDALGAILRKWAASLDVMFAGDISGVAALGLHSDGVQYTSTNRAGGAKSVEVVSMNILSAGTEEHRQYRIPLVVLRKARMCGCGCGGFDTLQSIFLVLAWSFRCLLSGVAPEWRHDGSNFTAFD